MTTHEYVKLYRATAIGRLTWPKRRRPRNVQEKPEKPVAPTSLRPRPVPSLSPDASPWQAVGYGGRAKLVMDTIHDLIARGERWRPKDVAEAIGAPLVPVVSHMKRLRTARLIPLVRTLRLERESHRHKAH